MTTNFDLDTQLEDLYASFPEASHQPIIGITTNFSDKDVTIREVFHKQVIEAGGTPLLIPPTTDKKCWRVYSIALTDCYSLEGLT